MTELIHQVGCGAGAPGMLPGVITSVSSKLVGAGSACALTRMSPVIA